MPIRRQSRGATLFVSFVTLQLPGSPPDKPECLDAALIPGNPTEPLLHRWRISHDFRYSVVE